MNQREEPPAAWRVIAEYHSYRDAMEALGEARRCGPNVLMLYALTIDGRRVWSEADDAALEALLDAS